MPKAPEYLSKDKTKSSKASKNWKVKAGIPKLPLKKQRRPGRGKEVEAARAAMAGGRE